MKPAARRLHLTNAVASCTRCPLSDDGGQTPPNLVRPSVSPSTFLLVIGDAPSAGDVRNGEPFTPIQGAGRHLHTALTDAEIPLEQVAYTNVVCCRPTRPGTDSKRGKRTIPVDRPPTDIEKAACRHHLTEVIRYSRPTAALLLGGIALSVFRHDLKLSRVNKLVFRFHEFDLTAAVLTHPLTFMRERDSAGLAEWRRDVEAFARNLWDGLVVPNAHKVCVECGVDGQRGVPVYVVDRDGAGYCWRHRDRSKALEVTSKWRTLDNRELQGSLL